MKPLELLIIIGGALHFAMLTASAMVPKVLDFRGELAKVSPFLRQLFWVYGVFIVLTLMAFGAISLGNAAELASGGALARSFCGFIAAFWTVRLIVQLFVYDPHKYLTDWFYVVGYRALTATFTYFVAVYGLAAVYQEVLQ